MAAERKIVFVYNADGGLPAQLKDYVHKIVAPQTYPCSLCAITFGNLGMKRAWRRFVRDLPYPAVFLHRDELTGVYTPLLAETLPAIFLVEDEARTRLVSAADLDGIPDVPALQALLLARLGAGAHAAPCALR